MKHPLIITSAGHACQNFFRFAGASVQVDWEHWAAMMAIEVERQEMLERVAKDSHLTPLPPMATTIQEVFDAHLHAKANKK